jgi:hypothetical protein
MNDDFTKTSLLRLSDKRRKIANISGREVVDSNIGTKQDRKSKFELFSVLYLANTFFATNYDVIKLNALLWCL